MTPLLLFLALIHFNFSNCTLTTNSVLDDILDEIVDQSIRDRLRHAVISAAYRRRRMMAGKDESIENLIEKILQRIEPTTVSPVVLNTPTGRLFDDVKLEISNDKVTTIKPQQLSILPRIPFEHALLAFGFSLFIILAVFLITIIYYCRKYVCKPKPSQQTSTKIPDPMTISGVYNNCHVPNNPHRASIFIDEQDRSNSIIWAN